MATGEVGEALRRLGISAAAIRLYLALLERAPVRLPELGAVTALTGAELAAAYAELVEAGLGSVAADGRETVAPLPPAAGLQLLGRRRAAELDASCITVAGAFDAFRRRRSGAFKNDLVEVATGEEIGPRLRQAWASACGQIRQLDSPPYFPIPTATDEALATLARGVTQRVVYSRESLEFPGNLIRSIEPCIAAGEQARVVSSVFVKLIIIDDACALVSLSIQEVDVHHTLLIVQPCGLFSALAALFEQTWHSALPLHASRTPSLRGPAGPPQRPLPADRRLLALLAGGVPDQDIARELGISRRTLFRRVELLMARLGATTRFQLALQAQRRGWL
ncbi:MULTISPECIES: LuxR family transcriptional regulator [unclassified Streptomyces]|uniref:helix-turn-helix transcriptional regulator n=1 Tax=unclassified Streptomyces TaxID=2593676 RepID=UPI001BEC9166|nr:MULTISPECIES: LuxR family transcriptional regulator [unclassified Streptomyces]MBT2407697.1 LuxR family transcriptional regulator [Streptomyces sp. ISL-21]MBT2610853.1 LuxR family transcriptional regulator [Streptomyces sp. ISL-87]